MALAHTQHIQQDFKGSQTAFKKEREVACGKSITHMLGVERECKKGDKMEIIFRGDVEHFLCPDLQIQFFQCHMFTVSMFFILRH